MACGKSLCMTATQEGTPLLSLPQLKAQGSPFDRPNEQLCSESFQPGKVPLACLDSLSDWMHMPHEPIYGLLSRLLQVYWQQ